MMLKKRKGFGTPETPGRIKTRMNSPMKFNFNKEPMKVYCRVRPMNKSEHEKNENDCVSIEDDQIVIVPPKTSIYYRSGIIQQQFPFTKVLGPDQKQEDVFEHTAYPLVESFLQGNNALYFVYGITNAGKTFTISGTKEEPGIIPRCLRVVFNSVKNTGDREKPDRRDSKRRKTTESLSSSDFEVSSIDSNFSDNVVEMDSDYKPVVHMSYLEIYNENIYDLIADDPTKSLKLRLDGNGQTFVANLTEEKVTSVEDAEALIEKGEKNRRVASTLLNADSSRSHSVLTIKLMQVPKNLGEQQIRENPSVIRINKFSIVDLAGSERNRRTRAVGARQQEANGINNSLMTLGRCMTILRANQKNPNNPEIVPYRDSKLTKLFSNYFQGTGKAVMTVNISPAASDYDETLQVLKFSTIAKEVATKSEATPRKKPEASPYIFKHDVDASRIDMDEEQESFLRESITSQFTEHYKRIISDLEEKHSRELKNLEAKYETKLKSLKEQYTHKSFIEQPPTQLGEHSYQQKYNTLKKQYQKLEEDNRILKNQVQELRQDSIAKDREIEHWRSRVSNQESLEDEISSLKQQIKDMHTSMKSEATDNGKVNSKKFKNKSRTPSKSDLKKYKAYEIQAESDNIQGIVEPSVSGDGISVRWDRDMFASPPKNDMTDVSYPPYITLSPPESRTQSVVFDPFNRDDPLQKPQHDCIMDESVNIDDMEDDLEEISVKDTRLDKKRKNQEEKEIKKEEKERKKEEKERKKEEKEKEKELKKGKKKPEKKDSKSFLSKVRGISPSNRRRTPKSEKKESPSASSPKEHDEADEVNARVDHTTQGRGKKKLFNNSDQAAFEQEALDDIPTHSPPQTKTPRSGVKVASKFQPRK